MPEYYLTRLEQQLLKHHANDIAQQLGSDASLIDLGAGNCKKAGKLLSSLKAAHYVPIDISGPFLQQAAADIQQQFPDTQVSPLEHDLSQPLSLPEFLPQERRVYFYAGSSIGNLSPNKAVLFLRQLRQHQPQCTLLLGVDLIKDEQILLNAYNDSLGVTAAFNRNALQHLNRRYQTNFDIDNWRHLAIYNQDKHRIEMHLSSLVDQTIQWPKKHSRRFRAGETIHTENSYKYSLNNLKHLLAEANFEISATWSDPQNWFALVCAQG